MITERYMVNLYGINTKYYTDDFVSFLWVENANNEYRNSGIFVTAIIDIRKFVCGEIRGCTLGELAHVISTVRNPVEVTEKEVFYNAFTNVLQGVRQGLGNPNMTLTIQNLEYFYFMQP